MPDEFFFGKKPIAVVVDNGSGMFQPPALDAFDTPIHGERIPHVFEDPLFGFEPAAFEDPLFGKTAPPVFEDPLFGFQPQGFEDPLFG